ncbi:MAG: 30S ribosomal protein S20 [Gemmataceae bacterium]|nr:30S ribosomal protein S20 [Gemmataceae bacterium]MDW8265077.1 30S ribosomal protein S20 [Gemmataceae bacterium]
MPHTKSAKKNLRKSIKRRLHNRSVKSAMKTQIKKVLRLAESGSVEELTKEYNLAAKKLDKAAAKRIIHPNLAARKKSQLAKLVHRRTVEAAASPSSAGSAGE